MQRIPISTRIEGQTHTRLLEIAEMQDRSISYLVRKAVEQYVKGKEGGQRETTRSPQQQEA